MGTPVEESRAGSNPTGYGAECQAKGLETEGWSETPEIRPGLKVKYLRCDLRRGLGENYWTTAWRSKKLAAPNFQEKSRFFGFLGEKGEGGENAKIPENSRQKSGAGGKFPKSAQKWL